MKEAGKTEDQIASFEKRAGAYVKEKLLPNFKDFEFYTGESMNPDGMYVPRNPPNKIFALEILTVTEGSLCSTTARTELHRTSSSGWTGSGGRRFESPFA
jgi:Translationally controlled tumour protein